MRSTLQRYSTPLLWLLLIVCVACFWVTLLPESFWLDETVTAFVLRHGAGHPSLAAGPRLDQTIYYWLPRASVAVLGFSEFSVRLPSLLATLISLLLLYRLAARLVHPNAGWLVVFLCFVPHEFTRQATDARPYGLGTCLGLLAMWFLMRWLDRGGWRDAIPFAAFAALLPWVHLVYWPFLAVFAVYALVRIFRRETTVPMWGLAAASAAVLACDAPLISVTLGLFHQEAVHVVTPLPNLTNILSGFEIPGIAAMVAAAWLAATVFHWTRRRALPGASDTVLLILWWLWAPLVLLLASWITGNSVFLPRYFSLALPGMLLAAAFGAGLFLPAAAWKPVALVLAVGIAAVHFVKEPFPPSRHSHWREAAAEVEELTRYGPTPVVCPSPFVEARSPVWTPAYKLPGFLFAHLDAYPLRQTPLLLPSAVEDAGTRYARAVLTSKIVPAGRFVLYGGGYDVNHWAPWFSAQPELANWDLFLVGRYGDVEVVLYRKRKH
ncbi:MAG TPA: glycosyltransferase family 39 protein [Bryobacteraceae bacterium]|nr:glycosyltransferase family 39 protein [Bryobacteraceae bacterium]